MVNKKDLTYMQMGEKGYMPINEEPDVPVKKKFQAKPFGTVPQDSTPNGDTGNQPPTSDHDKGFQYEPYTEGDSVKQAWRLLEQQLGQKPGEYQSQWQSQIDELMNRILNREKFSYDLNGDALYQQYKDQYVTQGKMAMMDTMGQAQAMTGGYGNSYAQSVGQQTYQGYLQQLNEVVPELYQLSLDQYNREGDELYRQYGMYADREDQDYGRYRDSVTDYQNDRNYYADRYDAERNWDYNTWADNRDFTYQQERDRISDERWQTEFDEGKRQFDMLHGDKSGNGSGNGGGWEPEDEPGTVPPLTAEQIREIEETAKVYANYGEGALLDYLAYMTENGDLSQDIAYSIYNSLFPQEPPKRELEPPKKEDNQGKKNELR